jgi:hypothetical protein
MVRRVVVSLTGLLFAGLLLFGACRTVVSFAPELASGNVPDSVLVVVAIPDTGYVHISKNGYRVFDLDAIVTDEDDVDSVIEWSFTPGPGLELRLQGDSALIGPAPNQVCTSYVVFTANDPDGQSASKTCPIAVFDEFDTDLLPSAISVRRNADTTVALMCGYRPGLRYLLEWDDSISHDDAYLDTCYLGGSPVSGNLTVEAANALGTTGVYFRVYDPANHVYFDHSIPVVIR